MMAAAMEDIRSFLRSSFSYTKTLNEDPRGKRVTLLGKIKGKEDAPDNVIVEIERSHICGDFYAGLFDTECVHFNLVFQNDIWHGYEGFISEDTNRVKLDIAYPAGPEDIAKKTKQDLVMVAETPGLYEQIVRPYMRQLPVARDYWIRNILDGASEADSVLSMDPDPLQGYCLLPDSKWDRVTASAMYLLLVFRDERLLSMRDLSAATHLPLLRHVRDQVAAVVREKYGVAYEQLRVFFHYPPTYYRLHLHICHIDLDMPGMSVGKAHLLDDVIDQLALFPAEGYRVRTLHYALGKDTGLYCAIQARQK